MKIANREENLKNIQDSLLDVLVIGGGATGAGVARDAALRGLKVGLVEKNDFGSGTSMHSTKLLHGGLRYLKNYEFGLVREAALERHTHLQIAPHLSEVMDFLVPLYKWSEDRPIMLRLGLILYDLLSFPNGIGRHKYLNRERLMKLEPLLNNPDLKSGGLYQDVRTDDSRLVLANIMNASHNGAAVLNYCEAISWEKRDGGVFTKVKNNETGQIFTVESKTLIICGGPWTTLVEELSDETTLDTKLRLTWGAHILLKQRLGSHPILMVNDDGRPVFLIPRIGYDLAGTTDIDYNGHPDDVKPTKQDVDYIINAMNKIFPDAKYEYSDVVSSYSGLRPLVYQQGKSTGKISRNHEIFTDDEQVITITGGKLTTYRIMAKEGVDKALKLLGLSKKKFPCTTKKVPLSGGEIENWDEFVSTTIERLTHSYDLDDQDSLILIRWYGSNLDIFEKVLNEFGVRQIISDRPWLTAQVVYSCRYEYARHPIDILRRRLPIMLEEGNGLEILEDVGKLMASELNWDSEVTQMKIIETRKYIERFIQVDLTEK